MHEMTTPHIDLSGEVGSGVLLLKHAQGSYLGVPECAEGANIP